MSRDVKPFKKPIYTTRPLLPNLEEVTDKLRDIWDTQWLTNNGPQHQLLEEKLNAVLNVPNLSLFNNGTTALNVACQSLDLAGEVITTPFTFPATPNVLTWQGITPIFCDIDPVTMNIDAGKIAAMVTPRTTAILAVHVFGTPCDVTAIQDVAEKFGLRVIYDAAHAFGVEIDDTGIGCFGDITMFSFHATKLFHTVEGGALTCKDRSLKQRIDLSKNFGIRNEEEVVLPGINGKMNEIQAALGLIVLKSVEEERNKRRILKEAYRALLQDVEGITLPESSHGVKDSYQHFVIRIHEKLFGISRDIVYTKFRDYNVFARKYFYPLCSNYPYYRHLPSSVPSTLPVANTVANEVLCMPFYGGLSVDDVEAICRILKSFQ